MKIAFVLPSDRLSGGNLVVYQHGSILQSLGHDVSIIFRSWLLPASMPHGEMSDNQRHACPGAPLWYSKLGYSAPCIDWNTALTRNFDLVVATWWETAFDIFALQSKKFGYFVQSDERRFYRPEESFLRAGVELSYHLPLIFFTEATWIQRLLTSEFSQQSYLIPNGVCTEKFSPVKPLEEKKPGVLRVLIEGAGAVPYKRVGLAFEAVRDLAGIEVWYVCGDGYREASWSSDRFLGAALPEEMPAIYSSCDVLLKLSVIEGFFLPPLEMMACGGTAIVTNVTGYEEYIRHGENALVVEMDNVEAAREAVVRLRDDAELLARLKKGASSTARGMTWDVAKEAYAQSLPSVASQEQDFGKMRALMHLLPVVRSGLACWQREQMLQDGAFFTHSDAKEMLVELDRQFKEIVGYFKLYVSKHELDVRVGAIENVLTGMAHSRGIKGRIKRILASFLPRRSAASN